jgi:hypothetical protein
MTAEALNAWLDRLPRTRLGLGGRLVPTYRTLGVVGYYAALATVLGGGLVRGLSLLVVAGVAAVSGLSFFLYAWARKAATGKEEIVLLEHVWFAFALVAPYLWALGEPLLPHLDVFAVSLCPFLALGRVGCLLAGCCHGRPSRVGITYGEDAARDGFPRHLVGVRLLPLPAFEAAGLLFLGATGFAGLFSAAPGTVLVWFLVGYAVLRFGLEGLRGDGGPGLLGLSAARWMCLAQFALAVGLAEHLHGRSPLTASALVLWGALAALLCAGLVLRRLRDPARGLLAEEHLRELAAGLAESFWEGKATPAARATSRGVTWAASRAKPGEDLHASLALPGRERNLELLCRLAARVLPGVRPGSARYSERGVLHVLVSAPPEVLPEADESAAEALYGGLLRPAGGEPQGANARLWYFRGRS